MRQTRQERSAAVGYAQNPLDRRAALRSDEAAMAALASDHAARFMVIAGDVPLLRRTGNGLDPLFNRALAESFGQLREEVFLGSDAQGPIFAVELDQPAAESEQDADGIVRIDLRTLGVQGLVPPDMLGVLGEAKSLLFWHRRHRFCAHCGERTSLSSGGWRRDCKGCGAQHFPRTDPVAIMLAVRGDFCLLGRQARFAPGVVSCLAGFIEPGETMEDAVRRELFEEAGIHVGAVRYLASQPWAFPSSLMIGCIAESMTEDLVVDIEELEHARWFSRDETRAILQASHPEGIICPPPIAIAHHLIRAWAIDGETP
jgi:NAD+ diphosphatase